MVVLLKLRNSKAIEQLDDDTSITYGNKEGAKAKGDEEDFFESQGSTSATM